jgi:riboflavin biosynthesis pyrimidine reductase
LATSALVEAGLVDELRLIVYPIISGAGRELFALKGSRSLELLSARPRDGGRVNMTYSIKPV